MHNRKTERDLFGADLQRKGAVADQNRDLLQHGLNLCDTRKLG